MSPEARPVTIGDKIKFEWPVMLTIVAGVVWIVTMLGDIKAKLVEIDTRLQVIERTIPSLQTQVSGQGERIGRLEATQK